MRICIDNGHGGNDPGAVNGKYLEKAAALSIGLKLGSILAAKGADIIYTRDKDETVELGERCQIANYKPTVLHTALAIASAMML